MPTKTKVHRITPPRAKALRAKPLRRNTAKIWRKKALAVKMPRPKSSRERVRAYRKRMRAKGLRLVQMWLPDTRTPEFAAQAHRTSLAIANSPTEAEDQNFVDAISWWNSDEARKLEHAEGDAIWWRVPEKAR
jgi:hypothetical protein